MKRQWIKVTRGSLLLAAYYRVIDIIEGLSGETDVSPLGYIVQEELLDPSWVLERVESGLLEVRVSHSQGGMEEYEEEFSLGDRRLVVRLTPVRELWGVSLSSLYEAVPGIVLRADSIEFKQLAFETTRSGIEYMGLYLDDGRVAFFEGEFLRVSLPFVKATGSIHTHPEGSCMLSLKDLESGLDLLVEGGLFEAVATSSCAFVMYRLGFVSEDDFFRVKEALLKARGRGLREPLKLESIKFYSLAY